MASIQRSSWSVTVMRGVAALCLAFLCLAHASTPRVFTAHLFGAYALTDGVLCVLGVSVLHHARVRALPLFAGVVGVSVGIYLLSPPRISLVALALATAAWSFVVGLLALNGGFALYRNRPGSWRLTTLSRSAQRRGSLVDRELLLAGVLALAFALAVLALALAGTAVSLTFMALFAAMFGYLHLRVGLSLGLCALAATDESSEVEGGHA
ncbi:MAG TPA: DUF308 domain-containing protein [Ktedonobacterales bacterium]|nr:DUF308 domain-containing protein [Ktedonobacterales bacterium]